MTKTQKRLISWIIAETLFIAGIVIGAVYDFSLTTALSGAASGEISTGVIPVLFSVLGEWPAFIIAAFSAQIIVANIAKKKQDTRVLIGCIIGDVVAFLCMYVGWLLSFATAGGITWISAVVSLVLAAALTFCIRFLIAKLDRQLRKSFFFPAVVTAVTEVAAFVILMILKLLWGRYELYQTIADSSLSATQWYVAVPFSGGMGFPSMQVFGSAIVLIIPMWLGNKLSSKGRTIFNICAYAWLVLVSVMVMCAGRAYLSDIAFGFAIAYACVEFASFKYEKSYLGKPNPKLIQTVAAEPVTPVTLPEQPKTEEKPVEVEAEKSAEPAANKPISSFSDLTDDEKKIIARAWAQILSEEEQKKKSGQITENSQPTEENNPPVQEEKQPEPPKPRVPSAPADDSLFWKRQQMYSPSAPTPIISEHKENGGLTLEQAIAAKHEADRIAAEAEQNGDSDVSHGDIDIALEQLAQRRERSNTIPVYDRPITKSPSGTPTSFSLEEVRAAKAELDARRALEAEQAGKSLDEQMRVASSLDLGKLKKTDISAPVAPRKKPDDETKAPASRQQQKPKTSDGTAKKTTKKKKKKAGNQSSNAVQMHFKFDSDKNELTTDLSDD